MGVLLYTFTTTHYLTQMMSVILLKTILLIVLPLSNCSSARRGNHGNSLMQEYLLPVDRNAQLPVTYEGSGSDVEITDIISLTSTSSPRKPPLSSYDAENSRKNETESVIDEHVKYVYIEKTSAAVFVVLTLLAISLIVALVVIGILWRKLRSRVYVKRVPVQIVRKCEDDEYSVMMDWT